MHYNKYINRKSVVIEKNYKLIETQLQRYIKTNYKLIIHLEYILNFQEKHKFMLLYKECNTTALKKKRIQI